MGREHKMVKIDSYWNYEDQPGVLVELNSGSFRGFLIPEGATEWEPRPIWRLLIGMNTG